MAGDFKVNKPEKFQVPGDWVEQTSKRTLNSKTYNSDPNDPSKKTTYIGTVPIHFMDRFAGFAEIDYASRHEDGYYVIDAGRFTLRYKSTGEIRFERNNGFVSFVPAFTDVGIEFYIHAHGLKANYYLDANSPNRLAWGFDFTSNHENQGKGKGRIKNAASKIVAELGELRAWDAAGMVVALTVNYTADSLTVLVDTTGVTFPVTLDPTVQDTSVTTMNASMRGVNASHAEARDTTIGVSINTTIPNVASLLAGDAKYYIDRMFIGFDLTALSGTVVDSARLFVYQDPQGSPPQPANGEDYVIVVGAGTFAGSTPNANWFPAFTGWGGATNDPHNLDSLTAAWTFTDGTAGSFQSIKFIANGNAITLAAFGDTLRLALIGFLDIDNTAPLSDTSGVRINNTATKYPYIKIYYSIGNPPGVSSIADSDSIKTVDVSVVVFIDSTGGVDLNSLGLQFFIFDGEADTSRVDSVGTFDETDSVSITMTNLLPDTSYQYRPVGVNSEGESFGVWDTLTTTITGGGAALSVDGRTVNTAK